MTTHVEGTDDASLVNRFLEFELHGTRAPMYAALARRIADDLEVRSGSREPFSRRIYVLSGKTLRIDATLQAEKKP